MGLRAWSDKVSATKKLPRLAGHPLDPLSADEIRQAAAIVRAFAEKEGCLDGLRFNVISLQVSAPSRKRTPWKDISA